MEEGCQTNFDEEGLLGTASEKLEYSWLKDLLSFFREKRDNASIVSLALLC